MLTTFGKVKAQMDARGWKMTPEDGVVKTDRNAQIVAYKDDPEWKEDIIASLTAVAKLNRS